MRRYRIRHIDGRQYKVTLPVYYERYKPVGFVLVDAVEADADGDALSVADEMPDAQTVHEKHTIDTETTGAGISYAVGWVTPSYGDDEEE